MNPQWQKFGPGLCPRWSWKALGFGIIRKTRVVVQRMTGTLRKVFLSRICRCPGAGGQSPGRKVSFGFLPVGPFPDLVPQVRTLIREGGVPCRWNSTREHPRYYQQIRRTA